MALSLTKQKPGTQSTQADLASLIMAAFEVLPESRQLVATTAKRMRALAGGAIPLVERTPGMSDMEVALREIIAGKIGLPLAGMLEKGRLQTLVDQIASKQLAALATLAADLPYSYEDLDDPEEQAFSNAFLSDSPTKK